MADDTKIFSSGSQALRKQEIPFVGLNIKTNRLVTAGALAAFIAYLGYKKYKKMMQEDVPPDIAILWTCDIPVRSISLNQSVFPPKSVPRPTSFDIALHSVAFITSVFLATISAVV